MSFETYVVIGMLVLCIGWWRLTRHRKATRIDGSGIQVIRSRRKPLFLSWSEVDRFGVANVCGIEGGLYQPGFTQYAGVSLTDISPLKSTKACADNRRLSDYDLLLTPDDGMSVEAFVAYLEDARAKTKNG